MIIGKYWSRQGLYEFQGHHYKPRWFAKYGMDPLACQNLAIEGNDAKPNPGWPKTIIVLGEQRWNVIKEHYGDIYGLTQLHCFHPGQAGLTPKWANPWKSSAYLLIHEFALPTTTEPYAKVAWMRPDHLFENDVYMFFEDAAPPVEEPETPVVSPTTGENLVSIPEWEKIRIVGMVGSTPVDLTVEKE